ncbi:MAG: leucine-rich repeat domain-containing protein, partial [Bacteroidales bacterium]|nr:leucine-rich repeat domain-containing protein [Bacteroidales bacterium]
MKRAVSAVLFVLLLSAVGMTKAFAQSFTMGYLNYSVNDDGTTVTVNGHVDGTEATGELVIPEMVTYNELTYSVTTIGEWAFGACFGFNGNLVIPNSVTTISDCAFCYCNGFTGNLVIPKSVTTIGGSAFYYCSGFNGNLVIPNSVTYIGGDAFSECAFSSVEY